MKNSHDAFYDSLDDIVASGSMVGIEELDIDSLNDDILGVENVIQQNMTGFIDDNKRSADQRQLDTFSELGAIASRADLNPIDHLQQYGSSSMAAVENFDDAYTRDNVKATIYYNSVAGIPDQLSAAIYGIFTPVAIGVNKALELDWDYPYITHTMYHADGTVSPSEARRSVVSVLDEGLSDDAIILLPVRGGANDEFLVPTDIVPVKEYVRKGEEDPLVLSPILFKKTVDLIGLNHSPNSLLGTGGESHTTIDRTPQLSAIYVKIGDDVIRFNTLGLNSSRFVDNKNGIIHETRLNLHGKLTVNSLSKLVDGSDLVTLADVVTDNLQLNISVDVSGVLNTETGETTVYFNGMSLTQAFDDFKEEIALDDSSLTDIVTAIEGAEGIGYTLDARVTNSNLSRECTEITLAHNRRTFGTQVHAPVCVNYPVNRKTSSSALNSLLKIAQANKFFCVLRALENTRKTLSALDTEANYGNAMDIYGWGDLLITPFLVQRTLDLSGDLNSRSSSERVLDMQSLIHITAHEAATEAYTSSRLNSTHATMFPESRPVFTVLCDPRIAAHQRDFPGNASSELFEMRWVSVPSLALTDKMWGTFHFEGGNKQNKVNPLDFGIITEGVDLVYNTPVSQGKQTFKKLTVHPIYKLEVINPVLVSIDVTGWLDAIGKIDNKE